MKMTAGRSWYGWMRVAHRDLGFLVVGLTIVYCISGILLTYRDTLFLKNEVVVEKHLQPQLSAEQLNRMLHLKGIRVLAEDERTIQFATGTYNKETGGVSYVSQELPLLLRKFNELHFVSSQDGRHWFTALYAVALLFLAVSSFWMYRPGSTQLKRGAVLAAAGCVVAVLLVFIT